MSDIKKTPGWIIAEWLRDEGRDDNGLPYYGRLIDMVNRLVTANIEHLKTWRHIDHQNPKESGYVLCCLDGVIKKKWYYSGIEKIGDTQLSDTTEAYYNKNVKYWMPMPPRAKDQDSYHEHTDEMISKQIAKPGTLTAHTARGEKATAMYTELCADAAERQQLFINFVKSLGADGALKNDGWVDRKNNTFRYPSYAYFDNGTERGSLVAIGNEYNYRMAVITKVEKSAISLNPTYHFKYE